MGRLFFDIGGGREFDTAAQNAFKADADGFFECVRGFEVGGESGVAIQFHLLGEILELLFDAFGFEEVFDVSGGELGVGEGFFQVGIEFGEVQLAVFELGIRGDEAGDGLADLIGDEAALELDLLFDGEGGGEGHLALFVDAEPIEDGDGDTDPGEPFLILAGAAEAVST
jgi:hypothetical protein